MHRAYHPLLPPIAIFYLVCSFVGVVGNGIMIVAELLRRLRSPCHYMITMNCLADLLHVSGHVVFAYHVLTGDSCSQKTCYFIQFLPCVGSCLGSPLIMVLGIDRMICCRFPRQYRDCLNAPYRYTIAQMVFPFAFASTLMYIAFIERDPNSDNQIACIIPMAMRNRAFEYFNYAGAFVNLTIICLYSYTAYVLWCQEDHENLKLRSVFKSIFATMLFVMFGWAVTFIVNNVSFRISLATDVAGIVQIYAGISVNLSLVCNVFIFYSINSDYRKCIRRLVFTKFEPDFALSEIPTIFVKN
ncbi:unnamed protein product [Caenorhabditis bovis]|uniref:G-protein coupled receptors family 1 profile domain-containing protein n=1 Tax=Caenorhabditis bovis TaxID=2654633 RepID=A0A8S1ED17_9PELO|nr:unnamed protein product [Caenorhabditis bovis]